MVCMVFASANFTCRTFIHQVSALAPRWKSCKAYTRLQHPIPLWKKSCSSPQGTEGSNRNSFFVFEVTVWKSTSKAELGNCPGTQCLRGKGLNLKIAMTVPTQWGRSINSWESLTPALEKRCLSAQVWSNRSTSPWTSCPLHFSH